MDFARSVAHLSILNPGAPTGYTDNTLGGSDEVFTSYISNLGKKCPLCAFNATGGQITVKSIQGLWSDYTYLEPADGHQMKVMMGPTKIIPRVEQNILIVLKACQCHGPHFNGKIICYWSLKDT